MTLRGLTPPHRAFPAPFQPFRTPMLKPALQLKLGQQLTMTPQLQQAIKLLQLPVLELQAQVMEALETNVMLEAEEDDPIDLTSLEPGRAGRDGRSGERADSGDGEPPDPDEPAADEVIVEMEDPWAENSTPSGDGARADDDDRPLEFTDDRSQRPAPAPDLAARDQPARSAAALDRRSHRRRAQRRRLPDRVARRRSRRASTPTCR